MIVWCWIGQRCSKYVRFPAVNRLEVWLLPISVYETIWMRSTATRRKHPLTLLAGKTTYWRWTWKCNWFYYGPDQFSNRKPHNKRMDMIVVFSPANSSKPCLAVRKPSTFVKMIYPTFADGWSGRLGTQNSELTHNTMPVLLTATSVAFVFNGSCFLRRCILLLPLYYSYYYPFGGVTADLGSGFQRAI